MSNIKPVPPYSSELRLGSRSAAAILSSIPIVSGFYGGAMGLIVGWQSIKKYNEANPIEYTTSPQGASIGERAKNFGSNSLKAVFRGLRNLTKIVFTTAAGALVGFHTPPPAGILTIGPAIVAADKLTSIGGEPKKDFMRHIKDIGRSIMPGTGVTDYIERTNVDFKKGTPLPVNGEIPGKKENPVREAPSQPQQSAELEVANSKQQTKPQEQSKSRPTAKQFDSVEEQKKMGNLVKALMAQSRKSSSLGIQEKSSSQQTPPSHKKDPSFGR